MTVHLAEHNLSYFSVPKCACSSLKHFFFEIENGFPFRRMNANGTELTPHRFYPSVDFAKAKAGMAKAGMRSSAVVVAVVRDPVERLLSCYSNRVAHYGALRGVELTPEDRAAGLTETPDLPTFVRHVRRYRELSADVRHHTHRFGYFLGEDPSFYERIFPMAKLGELVEFVRRLVGRGPELGRLQTGGPKFSRDDLSAGDVKKIETLYAKDYELYGAYF